MSVDRLKELEQTAFFTEVNKSVEQVAGFLYMVLDESVRLQLVDTLERFTEKLKGPTSS